MTEREEILDLFLNGGIEKLFEKRDPAEIAVKLRRAYEVISANPDEFPELDPQFIQGSLNLVERLENLNDKCSAITAELYIAESRRDSAFNDLLADRDLNQTPH